MHHCHECPGHRPQPAARVRRGAARTRRDRRRGAPRTDPAGGVQRARAPAQAASATRSSCARRAAWTPTPFARELAEPVRQALALLESALAHGPGFDPASATRAFRFYMSDLGQIEFLPPLVERVQREAPGVRLEAVALEVEDIADALATGAPRPRGRLPARRSGAPVRAPARCSAIPYLCLMRADHPIQRADARNASSKRRTRWSATGGGHRVIEEALERAGLARRIALRVPHFTVVPMVLERTDLDPHAAGARGAGLRAARQAQVAAAAGADPAGRSRRALARALRGRPGQPLAARGRSRSVIRLRFQRWTIRRSRHGSRASTSCWSRSIARRCCNALNTQMGRDLLDLWTRLTAEPGDVRCVVLTGAGEALLRRRRSQGARRHDRRGVARAARDLRARIHGADGCPLPVIAAVNGQPSAAAGARARAATSSTRAAPRASR